MDKIVKKLSNSPFMKYFERKVRKTIRKYKLFDRKDKVAMAVSGGKDSVVCMYVLNKLGYNVEGITIDASIGNYTKNNLENLKKTCKKYKIKLHVVSFREEFGKSLCYIRGALKAKGIDYSSCMICGILKRYLLNKYARELKFDVLVTGHNMDDEAQAFLMNIFRNDFKLLKRQGPVSGTLKNKKFVKRVKPLYFIREDEVVRYSKIMKFKVNYGICPCSVEAYRRQHGNILDEFEKKHSYVKDNMIKLQETIKDNLKKEKSSKIRACEICGEPASNEICKACIILKELNAPTGI